MSADSENYRQQTSRRYGCSMLALAWIAILGLLYVFFADLLSDFNNPNQSPETLISETGVTRVVLSRNRYGHYVATGLINQHPVEFMLDTGATSISIPKNVARRLKLTPGGPSQVQTANGTITVYRTQLDSVSIGKIRLHNIRAHINPHIQGDEILLGMSFLKHVDFTQTGKELIISQPAQP